MSGRWGRPPRNEEMSQEQEAKKIFNDREKLIELGRKANINLVRAGEIYRRIRKNKTYKDFGCKTFSEFLADPDLPYSSSTAYMFMRILDVCDKLNISYTLFRDLPYVKFRKLIPYINEKNKDDLISKALTLSMSDLRRELKEDKVNKGFKDRKPLPAVWRCRKCGKFVWDAVPSEICPGH